ncbi:MAG: hypothetical protein KU37_09350 [Sulfuricurvum sp. PC08-66]|nr:MAG: hypothetical protein KU37_09350 [Sulfuricurvum sp. PC08-66]
MRKFLLGLIALLWMGGCSTPVTPSEVADTFLSALADGDQKKARKYASEETNKLIDIANTFGAIPQNENFVFTLVHEEVNATHATITYQSGTDVNKTLQLRLIEGKWLVDERKQ